MSASMSGQPVDKKEKRGRPRKYLPGDTCSKCAKPPYTLDLCVNHARLHYYHAAQPPKCTSGKREHAWTAAGICKVCKVQRVRF